MRQAGVSLEHDDRAVSVEAEHLTLDSPQFASATTALAPRPDRPTGTSPQPAPNPIAVEVAERYARALTLSPTSPAPPEPRTPRRSRAAMRDRALEPAGRRDRGASRPTPARATLAGDPALETRTRVRAMRSGEPVLAPRTAARPAPPRASGSAARPRAASPAIRPRPTGTAPPPPATGPDEPTPAGFGAPTGLSGRPTGIAGRRTVTIRGRGAERNLSWPTYDSSRRPAVPPHERPGFRPDRAALWAFVLGLLLVLVAATSAHGATLVHAVH
jgi:hypothetical protein